MNVFFDVDYTILGWDYTLRPHTRAVFEMLIANGHAVYVWSGVGDRTKDLEKHELFHLVTGVYQKPLTNFATGLERYGVPVIPDFIVDDYPEIVAHFGGLHIAPYWNKSYADDELVKVPPMVEALRLSRCPASPPPPRSSPSATDLPN